MAAFLADLDGHIFFANPRAEEILQIHLLDGDSISLDIFCPELKNSSSIPEIAGKFLRNLAEQSLFLTLSVNQNLSKWTVAQVDDADGSSIFMLIEKRGFSSEIEYSRDRSLFESVPIQIWEEDYSQVKKYLTKLTSDGIKDLKKYLSDHPRCIEKCAEMVRVISINQTARKALGLRDKSAQIPKLTDVFSPETYGFFLDQIVAISQGKTFLTTESIVQGPDKEKKYYLVQWSVLPGHEENLDRTFVFGIDNTERKTASMALEQSELKFSTAFKSSPDSLSITSFDSGKYVDFNNAFLKITGYSREELAGESAGSKGIWGSDRGWEKFRWQLKSRGSVTDYRVSFNNRFNCRSILSISADIVEIKGEKCILSIARDITAQIEIQNALKESEKKYRTLVDAARDSILIVENSIIRFANPELFRVSGLKPEEVLNRKFTDFIAPEKLGQAELFYHKRRIQADIPNRYETRVLTKNGIPTDVEVVVALLEYMGKPAELIIMRDISDRKLMLAELKESEEKYRQLISNSCDAIYLMYKGKLEVYNNRFLEMFNCTREEIEKKNFCFQNIALPEERKKLKNRLENLEKGKPVNPDFEFIALGPDNENVIIEAKETSFPYKDGIAVQGVLRDVTLRRKIEKRFIQTQKMETIGQLAGGIAHDFNNLITVISGYSQMLLNQSNLDPKVQKRITLIKNAGDRAQSLTEKLLAFGRKQYISLSDINLNNLLESSVEMLSALVSEDIELEVRYFHGELLVQADPSQVEQILINLVLNARDALNEKFANIGNFKRKISIVLDRGTVSENPDVASDSNFSGPFAVICVSDNGTGMNSKTREKVFEPFFTTKEFNHGTGLGLSSVYGIIRQNSGAVDVESVPGEGTSFKVYWPLKDGTRKPE